MKRRRKECKNGNQLKFHCAGSSDEGKGGSRDVIILIELNAPRGETAEGLLLTKSVEPAGPISITEPNLLPKTLANSSPCYKRSNK